jgi:hypothetical protein
MLLRRGAKMASGACNDGEPRAARAGLRLKTILSGWAGLAMFGCGQAALAQTASPPAQSPAPARVQASAAAAAPQFQPLSPLEVSQLRQLVLQQQSRLDNQERELLRQRQQLANQAEAMRTAGLGAVPPLPSATPPMPAQANGGQQNASAMAQNQQSAPQAARPQLIPPPSAPTQTASAEADRPRSQRQADQLLLDAGGVLLPRWHWQIEPSLDWTHISSDRVNISGYTVFNSIVIGTIRVDDVTRDIGSFAVSGRVGLPRRTQLDLRVPYQYRVDRETLGVGTADLRDQYTEGGHLGDVEATASWQPFVAKGIIPATILRLRARFPTGESAFEIPRIPTGAGGQTKLIRPPSGSGHYVLEPGFTAVWRSDPLVLFIGAARSFPIERDFPVFGKIEPGPVTSFFAGLNLAVNERSSLNISFSNQLTASTRQNGLKLIGTPSNDARLGIGGSFGITETQSVSVTLQMGLTDQSPAYALSIGVPISLGQP